MDYITIKRTPYQRYSGPVNLPYDVTIDPETMLISA